MPRVEVEGFPAIETEAGKRLVLAIEDSGIDILHRCGGKARCTTCRVVLLDGDAGPMTPQEETRLAREGDLAPGTRLSCQILVENDLKVRVLGRLSEHPEMDDPGPRPDDVIPAPEG
jgi:ferredoxin